MNAEEQIREHGGLPLLVVPCLALALGPAAAPLLPAGPASLLDPAGAAVGVAGLTALWLLFVWPAVTRRREPGPVLRSGTALLLAACPFAAGAAFLAGTGWPVLGAAAAVLLGTAAVSAAWMVGPGREPGRDRGFVAAAILLVAAGPLANYALNEFAGSGARLGYRLSPPLLLRRILTEAPDSDPVPFLLFCLAASAALLGWRVVRPAAGAVAVLLALASTTAAGEVRPLLGEGYVPGRALPLLVTAEDGEERVSVTVPGRMTASAPARSGGTLVLVPAPAALAEVRTGDGRARTLALTPVPPGSLVVVLGPVGETVRARARQAGLFVSRATAGAEREDLRVFLAADAVLDPGGLLSGGPRARLRAAGVPVLQALDAAGIAALADRGPLRRPWEEAGRVLSGAELERLFSRSEAWDAAAAVRVSLLLAGYALVLLVSGAWLRRRALPAFAGPLVLLALSGAALGALRIAAPERPPVVEDRLEVRFGGRVLILLRFSAQRGGELDRPGLAGAPVPLGPEAGFASGFEEEAGWRLRKSFRPGERRIVVIEGLAGAPPAREGHFDLVVGPAGISRAGGPPVPPGEFLRALSPARGVPGPEVEALRKLIRLAEPPGRRYGVRLPTPDRGVLEVVPLGR